MHRREEVVIERATVDWTKQVLTVHTSRPNEVAGVDGTSVETCVKTVVLAVKHTDHQRW